MRENLKGFWKYPVGDSYRIVAQHKDDKVIIMVIVAHRKNVYKLLAKILK